MNKTSMIRLYIFYLEYIRFVHGSMEFGNLNAKSPKDIMAVVRTSTEVSRSKIVNNNGNNDSHSAEDVLIYLHIASTDVSRSSW